MNDRNVTTKPEQPAELRSSVLFGENPPNDGKEYDCQCARCGSGVGWEQCGACGGEGITGPGELYEQDPLWYDQDDYEACHQCNGDASWGICYSSPEWCNAHPLPGRESVERGTIEWFPLKQSVFTLPHHREHSRKPKEWHWLVEQVDDVEPRLELFARRKRHGWHVWGNELANDVEMPNAKLRDAGKSGVD